MSVSSLPMQGGQPDPKKTRVPLNANNAITTESPAIPPEVPVWMYLGREVVDTDGCARALAIGKDLLGKWRQRGLIAPIRAQRGQLGALWEVSEIERVAEQAIEAKDQSRADFYRETHRRQRGQKR